MIGSFIFLSVSSIYESRVQPPVLKPLNHSSRVYPLTVRRLRLPDERMIIGFSRPPLAPMNLEIRGYLEIPFGIYRFRVSLANLARKVGLFLDHRRNVQLKQDWSSRSAMRKFAAKWSFRGFSRPTRAFLVKVFRVLIDLPELAGLMASLPEGWLNLGV